MVNAQVIVQFAIKLGTRAITAAGMLIAKLLKPLQG
jgi:hypothetical protein